VGINFLKDNARRHAHVEAQPREKRGCAEQMLSKREESYGMKKVGGVSMTRTDLY